MAKTLKIYECQMTEEGMDLLKSGQLHDDKGLYSDQVIVYDPSGKVIPANSFPSKPKSTRQRHRDERG